ncbi:uncharacterized protein JCM15063_005741 [Sporobolomyces koalae]|uniref:uncharacterized protein n=1 Tax=Sporobolomyces koalae TaxID=500713 RepID=UPI00316C29FA
MHPAHQPRPRPPAQRAPSSRLTALPTPLSPRRSRPSALAASPASAPAPHASHASPGPVPVWSSAIPPDTPPLGIEEQLGASSVREDESNKVAREYAQNAASPSPEFIPTSTAHKAQTMASIHSTTGNEAGIVEPRVHIGPNHDDDHHDTQQDLQAAAVAQEGKAFVLDAELLATMSREELEKMLSEADRIIRDKEQELSVFTTAGEGLLKEYHSLRDRHESLLSRQRSTSGASIATLRPSRLCSDTLSPSSAADTGSQRGSRISLGAISASAAHHRRISSGRTGIASSSSYVFSSSSSSTSLGSANATPPHSMRFPPTADSGSPSSSPTTLRTHRLISSSSVASLFAPPARTVLSPKMSSTNAVDSQDIERLNHLNYSLAQRVEELEAESEISEREGRKKLRRLEKELVALKEDLEHSEGRNVALELENQAKKKGNNGSKSGRNSSVVTEDKQAESDSSLSDFTAEIELGEARSTPRSESSFSSRAVTTSPSPSRFLAAPSLLRFRSPGNSSSRLRAVSSTSSLASLPRAPLFDLSVLDAQQDELLNQLIAKIDELQDANEAILEEREDMEEKLEIAREEVREWMGKCEELEDHQHKIEYDGTDRRAIGWLDDESARPETRLSRFNVDQLNNPRSGSPTPPSSVRPELGRSLRNELCALWPEDASTAQALDDADLTDEDEDEAEADPSASVILPDTTLSNLHVQRIRRHNPRRTITPLSFAQRSTSTAHNLVAPGSLGHTTLDGPSYDALARRAEELEPVWADESIPERARIASGNMGKQRLIAPPGADANGESGDSRQLRSKKERRDKKKSSRRKSKHLGLSDIHFGSDEEETDNGSTSQSRRTLALRRLGLEASSRNTSRMFQRPESEQPTVQDLPDEEDDADSIVSSNYDLLDNRDNLDSNDFYPITLRARYHPRMLTHMMRDRAIRHVVTLITWLRFLIVLAMALSYAVYQGPRKTLGLVDGRRNLR